MAKHNKIVLFDIDHTVFDANLYRVKLYANLAKALGSDTHQFSKTAEYEYAKLRKKTNYFTPDTLLRTILADSKSQADFKKAEDVFWSRELYESCVYPEVKKVFSYLSTNNIPIGIFSTGDILHQKIKIESLKEYLSENHIYISPNKFKIIKTTLKIYKDYRTFLVDDYPQILEEAKSHHETIFTVFINRNEANPHMMMSNNFTPDATITNLGQLIDIIKNNN